MVNAVFDCNPLLKSFNFPSRCFTIPPAVFVDDRPPFQRTPYVFGRQENSVFPEFNVRGIAPQYPLNFPFDPSTAALPRNDLAVDPAYSAESAKKPTSTEQSRIRRSDGEVTLLIAIYGEEYPKRDKGKSLETMWERIAARLVAESKEINDFISDKSAKNCRDKINNLNKIYKTVKDKSKLTGEGSEGIKSFPEFDALDEIWGTRDSVNPKYVMEAGTSHTPTTPVPSPSFSSGGSASNTTASRESELDEESPLSQALVRSGARRGKGKELVGQPGKRARPEDDDDDALTDDDELEQAKRLFFKDKKKPDSKKKKPSRVKRTTNVLRIVLGAIRELGTILKK